jgi:putative FmdB family regulatory protein
MPTYDYQCRDCDQTFTVQLSIKDHDIGSVRCSNCKGTMVRQVMAPFVAVTSKKS